MTERSTKITSFWSMEANAYLLRAHHWGPHGYSTKTVLREPEAHAFFAHCDRRKPKAISEDADQMAARIPRVSVTGLQSLTQASQENAKP